MTTTDAPPVVEPTPPVAADEQALFEEARRQRRRRWRYGIGISALVVAGATVGGLVAAGVLGAGVGNAKAPGEAPSPASAASPAAHACPTGHACIYVLNKTGIVPIGLQRDRIGTPIRPSTRHGLGDGLGNGRLDVTPSGRTAYVLATGGITPVNLGTGTFGHPLPLRPPPGDVADSWLLGPSGRFFYLEVSTVQRNHSLLEQFNLISRRIERSITLPGNTYLEAISPDGATGYVSTDTGRALVAVNLVSGSTGPPVSVPSGIDHLAVSADGDMAYATGGSFVTPIDLVVGKTLSPIRLDHAPTSIVLAPSGQTAYVTGNGGYGPPGRPAVMAVDLVTDTVTKSIRLPAGATAIAMASRP